MTEKDIDMIVVVMNLVATKEKPKCLKNLNCTKQAVKIVVCAVSITLSAGSAFAAEGGMGFYINSRKRR